MRKSHKDVWPLLDNQKVGLVMTLVKGSKKIIKAILNK